MKGPSWLATTPCFNIIRGSSVDYMHCVLLGMCRHLLKLWLLSKQHDEPWYIGTKVAQMDGRLLAIKPPEEMQRTPRSLESTRQYWKGKILQNKEHVHAHIAHSSTRPTHIPYHVYVCVKL